MRSGTSRSNYVCMCVMYMCQSRVVTTVLSKSFCECATQRNDYGVRFRQAKFSFNQCEQFNWNYFDRVGNDSDYLCWQQQGNQERFNKERSFKRKHELRQDRDEVYLARGTYGDCKYLSRQPTRFEICVEIKSVNGKGIVGYDLLRSMQQLISNRCILEELHMQGHCACFSAYDLEIHV